MPESFPLPKSDTRTYGDYVGYYMSGVEGLRAGVGALEQYYGTSGSRMQAVGAAQRNRANIEQQQVEEQDLTPAARELLRADIGSPSFWAHPVGWGIARIAQSSPYLFASLAPIAMTGGSGAGLALGAVANGTFSAGDITNSWMQQVDSHTSDELAELSPSYAEDIINGVSEEKARENLVHLGLNNKPVVAMLLGIGTTYLGLGGAVAGAAERVAGKSILPRMAGGVLKGGAKEGGASGLGETIQSAAEDLAVQSSAEETGLQDRVDYGQTLRAGLTGLVVGGPLGAVAGGISGFGHGAGKATPAKASTEVEPEVEVEATTAAKPPPAVTQAIPTTPAGQSTATQPGVGGVVRRPSPDYVGAGPPFPVTPTPKPEAIPTVDNNKTVLPDPLSPTPEQTVALQHKVTPPQVTPPQVTKPTVTPPQVTPPQVTPPQVTPPNVTRPEVTPPQVTPPQVTPPQVTRPEVTPPQVTPPQVTRPEVTPPNVTAPTVTTPTVSPTGPAAAPLAAPEAAPVAAPAVGPSGRRILSLARERTTPVKKIAGRGRVAAEKPRPAGEYVAKPAGRILEDLTYKERNPEVWAKYNEDQVIAGKRRAEDKAAALGPEETAKLHEAGIRTGKIGEEAKVKLAQDETLAKTLFDRKTPEADAPAETREQVQARVKKIMEIADETNVTPGKVMDVTADHLVWLRTAQELNKAFEKGKASDSHIATFIANEKLAKAGDFASMRDRSGGETASRAHQDVELLSDEVTPSRSRKAATGESEQIEDTGTGKSAQQEETELRAARNAPVSKPKSKTFEKAEALKGKRVEITPELRAKYEGVSKFAEEVKPAEQLQEKVTEPEPVVEAPKAAEIKEKVKAKKAPAKEKPPKVAKAVETAKKVRAPRALKSVEEVKARVAKLQEKVQAKVEEKLKARDTEQATKAPKAAEIRAKKKAKDQAVKEKFQKYIGDAEVGDTITMSKSVGYAAAGEEYKVLGITTSGVEVQSPTGSRTILSPTELAVAARANTIYSVDKPTVTLPSDPLIEENAMRLWPKGWSDITGGGNKVPTIRDKYGTDNRKEIIEKHFKVESKPLSEHFKAMREPGADEIDVVSPETENYINTLLDRLEAIVGHVPVYIVSEAQMNELYPGGALGVYNSRHNIIYVAEGSAKSIHTNVHEAAHAAFIQALNKYPEIRAVVTRIASEFKQALNAEFGRWDFYAFRNADEFIAEALGNVSMQYRLARTQASADLRSLMRANAKLGPTFNIRTLWDAIRIAFGKAVGLSKEDTQNSLLDVFLQATAELDYTMSTEPTALTDREGILQQRRRGADYSLPDTPWYKGVSSADDFPIQRLDDYTKAATQLLPERFQPADKVKVRKARMIWAQDSDHLAQSSKFMGGEKFAKSTQDVVNLENQLHTRALEILRNNEPFQLDYITAYQNNKGPVSEKFGELLNREGNSKLDMTKPLSVQKGVSKNALVDVWHKAEHARLSKEWAQFAKDHPDLAKVRGKGLDFFKKEQAEMQMGLLRNHVLGILGVDDEALALKLFKKEEELTPEEITKLGGKKMVNLLQRSPLTSHKGPYYPQFRMGEFVTAGKYAVTSPSDAKTLGTDGNHFEYSGKDARKRAMDFARKQDLPTVVETTWVDPLTNETFFEDLDPEGNPTQIKAGPAIPEAEKRFRVRIENDYMKMHDSLKLARIDAAELKNDPSFTLDHLEPRKFNMSELPNAGRELLSHEIRDVLGHLEKHPNWDKLTPIQREELKMAFITLSLNMIGSNRIQNRMRPRRGVKGASTEWHKVWDSYMKSSAGYRSKLEIQPQLDKAIGQMNELASDKTDGATEKTMNVRRVTANELTKRVTSHRTISPPTNINKWVNRGLMASFTNYLATPSYVINGLVQVPMLSAPTLMAEHTYGGAIRALGRAYSIVQPHKGMWKGFKDMLRATKEMKDWSNPTKRTNYLADIMPRLSTGEKEMLQHVVKNGGLAPEAGLEIDAALGAGWGDTLLDKVTNIARTMPLVGETVNRVTTAIAAYDLGIQKGWSQEKAQQHALDIVNRTQFNYANTNMPPIISSSIPGQIIGQFKKYGIGLYNLYGYNIGKYAHAATGAERSEAIHALALLTASHAIMAGAMGIVGWEPVRWLVIGANQAGLTDFTWADVEHAMRELGADVFGPYAGELIMKGLPRALGIDVSGRLGGSSALTFGEPRDTDDQSLWAYFGDMAAGAMGGSAMELIQGTREMMHGDIAKGMQKVSLIKSVSDVIGAVRGAVAGKTTGAGYKVYDPTGFLSTDFVAGILGYQTARHAELSEQRTYFYDVKARAAEERDNLLRDWYNASPNKKASVWKSITQFNQGRVKDEQVTMGDLNNYSKRRKSQDVAKGGVVLTRRDRRLWEGLEQTYAKPYFGE